MPATMLLSLCAGAFVERVWNSWWLRSACLALGVVSLAQAVRFDVVMREQDTRNEFEGVLAALPAGSIVVIDHYGPLPERSRAALERTRGLRELYGREAHRMAYFEAGIEPPGGAGIDAIGAEELFGIDAKTREYAVKDDPKVRALGATPGEVLATLGVTHLVLAERRPGVETRPLAPLVAGQAPFAALDPSSDERYPCDEAFLPTEMDFPLAALWQVNRPGPRLVLYRLPR